MPTKIRNVELLTLARSDAGTPVLGHVGVGIDANLIQDFEMGLSRVSSAAQFNLALNTEGATTNTAHFGGIAFTQGASADTVMASIKAVNTSVDGYIDLAFNTRSVDNALLIKANGDVSINNANASLTINATSSYPFINFEENGTVRFQQAYDITNDLAYFLCNQSGSQMWFGVNNAEVMRLSDGKVGIGTGSSALTSNLTVQASDQADLLIGSTGGARALIILDGSANGDGLGGDYAYLAHETDGRLTIANSHAGNVITLDGKVGIGTGSSAPSQILEIKSSSQTKLLINRDAANDAELEFKNTEQSWTTGIDRSNSNTFTIATGTSLGNTTGLRLTTAGRVGIGTGVSALTELLEVNGNAKATKFIGPLEGNADTVTTNANLTGDVTSVGNATSIAAGVIVNADIKSDAAIAYSKLGTIPTWNQDTTGNAATATALETTRNIVVGKSSAGAGDIDAITQSFDGGANISFDSELNSHLPSNLRATTSSNIADEPSNNAVKIIGSDINTPRLKINRQGLIVGFEEVATSGGGGSGGISALTLNTNGLLYLNSGFTSQTATTSTSTPTLNLYLNALGLFTSLTETGGTMSITIGGTTKNLILPDASFTQLDLGGTNGSTLQVEVGGTLKTVGLSTISVANATNAENADNIAISSENTNATRYLSFVNGTSGDRALKVDAGLTYNPSSNTLTTTTFSGALYGNATTSSGLLVGSTTYSPVYDATGSTTVIRNSAGDIKARYLLGTYVNTSDNVQNSNISYIMAKFGDNYHRSATADKVRAFLGNNRFLPSPTGGVYPLTVSNATSAGSATTAGSAGSISAGVGGQAFSAVTANGFVKLSGGNGTLSVGALVKGDIPDNDANTTGKANTAGTADVADTVTFGSLDISASHANTASTLVVRGADKSINVGALSSTDITAQSLVLTDSASALEVQEIIPRGGSILNWGEDGSNWPGGLTPGYQSLPNWYVRDGSQVGDGLSNTKGAFKVGHFGEVFSWDGYFAASDARVKNDIQTFSLGLDFVRLIEPKQFTWSKSTTPRIKYGVLAQEMEEAVSQLVDEETSFINIQNYHKNSDEENEQALKTIENNQVMWVLFNAVKQLDAKVQELEKQLDKS